MIRPDVLRELRHLRAGVKLIHYCVDDMGGPHNQSSQYLESVPLYDLHVTTKSYNVNELKEMGAKDVLFVNNGFCPFTHKPSTPTREAELLYGGQIGFIGTFEEDRAEAIAKLAERGYPVRIWGNGWSGWGRKHLSVQVENWVLVGEEYARAVANFKINLGFLRKLNRDLQTTRSVEIPACGGFLLAERTTEHLQLFKEGEEAEFFSDQHELVEKVAYYLADESQRIAIAGAGLRRTRASKYEYDEHMVVAVRRVMHSNLMARDTMVRSDSSQ
jgi:spore maturation protein CgeB